MTTFKIIISIADVLMVLMLIYFLGRTSPRDKASLTGFSVMLITYIASIFLIWQ